MSKKKKELKKLAKANIKILKSGKIKVSKGNKIDIRNLLKDSIDNSVVSRIEGIVSKEEPVIDISDLRCDITSNLTNEIQTINMLSRMNTSRTQTLVILLEKKKALDEFTLINNSILGQILRTSTLGAVYKEIKSDWINLNKNDKTNFTNVLYVPDVFIFLTDNGEIKDSFTKINVLILAVPSINKIKDENKDEISNEEFIPARIINDILESIIRCGCKDIVINPFGIKHISIDNEFVPKIWTEMTSVQRVNEQISSIVFTLENENEYVVFNATRNNLSI